MAKLTEITSQEAVLKANASPASTIRTSLGYTDSKKGADHDNPHGALGVSEGWHAVDLFSAQDRFEQARRENCEFNCSLRFLGVPSIDNPQTHTVERRLIAGRERMRARHRAVFGGGVFMAVLFVSTGMLQVSGQTRVPEGQAKASKPALTPWGEPDLRGVWDNASTATPWERPAALAGKTSLTDEEVAERQQAENVLVAERESGKDFTEVGRPALADSPIAGNEYNSVWYSEGRPRTIINRTSLVVDPPDGRVPYRPEVLNRLAYKRQIVSSHPPVEFSNDSWLDRDTGERCLTDGLPGLLGPQGYNSRAQIFQSPGWVAIVSEMYRGRRVIPTDGRPHVSSAIRQWFGDSVGHWEGETLVIDTVNFADKTSYWWQTAWRQSSPTLHLVERLTRVSPTEIEYRMTVEDPATFTRPWTAVSPMVSTTDIIYEYACHEGNYAMANLLNGARAEERAALGRGSK